MLYDHAHNRNAKWSLEFASAVVGTCRRVFLRSAVACWNVGRLHCSFALCAVDGGSSAIVGVPTTVLIDCIRFHILVETDKVSEGLGVAYLVDPCEISHELLECLPSFLNSNSPFRIDDLVDVSMHINYGRSRLWESYSREHLKKALHQQQSLPAAVHKSSCIYELLSTYVLPRQAEYSTL